MLLSKGVNESLNIKGFKLVGIVERFCGVGRNSKIISIWILEVANGHDACGKEQQGHFMEKIKSTNLKTSAPP